MSESKLMKWKRDIEKNDKQIQRNEGKLSSAFDSLKNSLNLPENTSNKDVLDEVDTKLLTLETSQEKDRKRLKELITGIEGETEEWED